MDNLIVSVSGGKTSMFMAIWISQNWKDKRNIVYAFANTGLEHENTLKFVDYCAYIFGLNIVWLEAVVHPKKGIGTVHKIVDFATASRNGEPMLEVVKKYGIPNKSYPHCNRELKLAPIHSYATSLFGGADYKNYKTAIGIRVDEIDRMRKNYEEYNIIYPLVRDHPTTKPEVLDFWRDQVYSLELPEHYGNCRACFKKSDRKLATISVERPQDFAEVIHYENNYSMVGSKDGKERKMFRDHKSSSDIFAIAKCESFVMFTDENWQYDPELDEESPCSLDCSLT
jgi:hypothetical protein